MEGGGQERRGNKREGGRRDTLAGRGLAAEAGCRTSRGGAGPRVQPNRGNRDQFCQNWVHTPGAAELGWPRERLRGRGVLLFISLWSELNCFREKESGDAADIGARLTIGA